MIIHFLKGQYKPCSESEVVQNGLTGLQLRNKGHDSNDILSLGCLTVPILKIQQSSCDNGNIHGLPDAGEEVQISLLRVGCLSSGGCLVGPGFLQHLSVCSGHYNNVPQARWLKQQTFVTVIESGKSKITRLADSESGKEGPASWFKDSYLLTVSSHGKGTREFFKVSSTRVLIPFLRTYPS